MFVIRYHKRGNHTKYFNGEKLVTTLKCAMAFGESFRSQFEEKCNGTMTLKTLNVSEIAEMMYENEYVKVKDIVW